MLTKIEFTFSGGKVNPSCHVVTRELVFNSDGAQIGMGQNHRAVVKVADDAGLNTARLSDAEQDSVRQQLAATRQSWPVETEAAA
jgi:hypothetical protein